MTSFICGYLEQLGPIGKGITQLVSRGKKRHKNKQTRSPQNTDVKQVIFRKVTSVNAYFIEQKKTYK